MRRSGSLNVRVNELTLPFHMVKGSIPIALIKTSKDIVGSFLYPWTLKPNRHLTRCITLGLQNRTAVYTLNAGLKPVGLHVNMCGQIVGERPVDVDRVSCYLKRFKLRHPNIAKPAYVVGHTRRRILPQHLKHKIVGFFWIQVEAWRIHTV